MRLRGCIWVLAGLALAWASSASAAPIVIDFETEDDGVTPLVNGQIVDPAFDGADLEFGTYFNLSTSQLGVGTGHLGATIFDSDPAGPNAAGADPDLLVDMGNLLILQNDQYPTTSVDGTYGLLYDTPNDEDMVENIGALIFDFTAPVFLVSVDIIDANGGYFGNLILTDSEGDSRTYEVPAMWTGDINACGGSCNGFDTLDLTSLVSQLGEGGSSSNVFETFFFDGFDANDVIQLEIQVIGNPASGGIDNLTFVPEPSTGLLVLSGLAALAHGRRRRLGRA